MTPFPSFFSLPLFFSFFLLFFILSVTSETLINNTCKLSAKDDPNIKFGFCTTSLQAAPASQCATLRGLGMISIRLIRYNVTDTRCHIRNLLKDKKLDHFTRAYLNDCFQLYSDAIDSTKDAMKYFKFLKFYDANVQISAVMDAATTCEDGFQERNLTSPLTKRNNDTFQLCAVSLELMHMLQEGSD